MRSGDIWLVIGTRPEAIKLKPVADALSRRGLRPVLILTGQHPSLSPEQFALGGYAAVHLGCAGEADPSKHVRKVTAALLPLLRNPPAMLVVQGDTSSALGAALAGFMAGVPVAHVEAGLRSHDPALPWPEEEYRTAIDARADLLFAPTNHAAANLDQERLAGEVYVTGNTGIDALLRVVDGLPPQSMSDRGMPKLLVTCHRRESWGEGLDAIGSALIELARSGVAQIDFVLHPNKHVAARMTELLQQQDNIALLQPCTHAELILRMRDADLILSDSGGIQEEAPALGVPLLVLREKTERPEGVLSGNMRLVGTATERILAEARALLSDPIARAAMTRRAFPYGDGRAAPRIAALIEDWLERRDASMTDAALPQAANW